MQLDSFNYQKIRIKYLKFLKSQEVISEPFRNKIEHLFAVPVEFEPESENPQKIEDEAVKLKIPVTSCASITEAIHKCINIFPNQKFRIIICGSLYLMGDVLNANKI